MKGDGKWHSTVLLQTMQYRRTIQCCRYEPGGGQSTTHRLGAEFALKRGLVKALADQPECFGHYVKRVMAPVGVQPDLRPCRP